uniref:Ig-like domain-containing protein n=1 Tax=Stegastes partitus TaxID=144197 RepID=A0A3B5A3E7_9TELE
MVMAGSDVVLPCSLDNKNIELALFDWMKDGRQDVFLYDDGTHDNNSCPGEDEQFKGRVSHFPDELLHGNASIIIRNTRLSDSGSYTCDFPHIQQKRFHIELLVAGYINTHDIAPVFQISLSEKLKRFVFSLNIDKVLHFKTGKAL